MKNIKVGEVVKYGIFVSGEDILAVETTLNYSTDYLDYDAWQSNPAPENPFTHIVEISDDAAGAFSISASIPAGAGITTTNVMIGTVSFVGMLKSDGQAVRMAVTQTRWRDSAAIEHSFDGVVNNDDLLISDVVNFNIWLQIID